MTNEEAKAILKNEVKCIQYQDTPKCARNNEGTCANCPLVLPTENVLEAFRLALDALSEPKGKWLPTPDDFAEFKCSVCDKPNFWEDNYCPNCGARMEGGKA